MTQSTTQSELAGRVLDVALAQGALMFGDFALASGVRSTYYFDGRLLTLSAEGAELVGRALLPLVRGSGAVAVGGPTLGADPMATAVSMLSVRDGGPPLPAFIVRKGEKDHGTAKLIEGPLPEGAAVAVLDDACSTGGSLIHAVNAVESVGCHVTLVACILDRHQGGGDYFLERGYRFASLLEADTRGHIRVSEAAGLR